MSDSENSTTPSKGRNPPTSTRSSEIHLFQPNIHGTPGLLPDIPLGIQNSALLLPGLNYQDPSGKPIPHDIREQARKATERGGVPYLFQCLQKSAPPHLQLRAAQILWCIAEWGTSPEVLALINSENGAEWVKLLATSCPSINRAKHFTLWTLASIAKHAYLCMEILVNHGAVTYLVETHFHPKANFFLFKTAMKTLLKFFQHHPSPPIEKTKIALPYLEEVLGIGHFYEIDALKSVCDVLLAICRDGVEDSIGEVVKAGICPRLVKLLSHKVVKVRLYVLEILGIIGSNGFIDEVINKHSISALLSIMSSENESMEEAQIEVCRMITNIIGVGVGGNEDDGSRVVERVIGGGFIPPLMSLLRKPYIGLKEEAVAAMSNAILWSSEEQTEWFWANGHAGAFLYNTTQPEDVITRELWQEAVNKLMDDLVENNSEKAISMK